MAFLHSSQFFFFFLDYKKGKNRTKTKEQRLFIPTTLVKYHTTRTDRRQKNNKQKKRHAGSCFRLHFYILKGKKYNNQFGKKRTKPRKCKPKKKRPHFSDHMHAEYLKSPRIFVFANAVRSFKGKPSYECRWGQGKNAGFEISVSYLCLYGGQGTSDDNLGN